MRRRTSKLTLMNVGGLVPLPLTLAADDERFELMMTRCGSDNRADQLVIESPVRAASRGKALAAARRRARREARSRIEMDERASAPARCMACGISLVAREVGVVAHHVTLDAWLSTNEGPVRRVAPERSFCTWGHLAALLDACPTSGHLLLVMSSMAPAALLDNG